MAAAVVIVPELGGHGVKPDRRMLRIVPESGMHLGRLEATQSVDALAITSHSLTRSEANVLDGANIFSTT